MEKLYYSISEVAEQTGLSLSNIRFWEKEFTQLNPKRNEKGTRFYSEDDVKLIYAIKYLTENEKRTLDGVRKILNFKKDESAKKQEAIEGLLKIRKMLQGIADNL